jgi:hypothetical protein
VANNGRLSKVAFAAAGLVAGVVIAGTLAAQAATSTPSPSTSSGTSSGSTAEDPHPGDNGADGVPESQEHHGRGDGHGHGLDLSGTVTAVGANSVTIKTSAGTTTYAVTSTSDIDKSGEAELSDLVVGDKVTFSVDGTNSKQIDKLHAGDETKNFPQHDDAPSSTSSSSTSPSGA